jgi:hypothetical protein
MPESESFNPPALVILDPHGKPARLARTADCPQCGADAEQRVKNGFGSAREFCQRCAYEFPE